MITRLFLLFLLLCVQSFSSDFESETPDLLTQPQEQKKPNTSTLSIAKEFAQEDAIYKPDPLLETLHKEKKEEPTLLEKLLLQNKNKKVKNPKKVFQKPLIENDGIITQDPLLDEL